MSFDGVTHDQLPAADPGPAASGGVKGGREIVGLGDEIPGRVVGTNAVNHNAPHGDSPLLPPARRSVPWESEGDVHQVSRLDRRGAA